MAFSKNKSGKGKDTKKPYPMKGGKPPFMMKGGPAKKFSGRKGGGRGT
jgi:hypothetical protein